MQTDSLSSESPPLEFNPLKQLASNGQLGVEQKGGAPFKIFVHSKEHDQTVAVTLRNRHTKIQSILTSIVQRKSGWARDRYFLINAKNEQILNPERSLNHYNITNESVFILTRKNFRKLDSASGSASISRSSSTKEKLTIICSFGAPYDKQKLVSTYFSDASLDQYALKIKEKFGMPKGTMITFRCAKPGMARHGAPFLGKHRKCGLQELDINANDEVLAQTNGINLILKPFAAPDDTKIVEIFSGFSLSMLRAQIEKELGIEAKHQKWLIRSKGRLVRDDKDCRDIAEYETITILSGCGCCAKMPAVSAVSNAALLQSDIECVSRAVVRHDQLAQNTMPLQPVQNTMPMLAPIMPSPIYTMAPEYAQFPQFTQNPNYHNKMWTPLLVDNYMSACGNFAPPPALDTGHEIGLSVRMERARTPCRHGHLCRFLLNPELCGPCHFYHPPSDLPAKASSAAKRRRRGSSRSKMY